uniref:Uncharacterized protein n=1 Tax=Ceratitis capitata TaxID=7213 RepID=W8BH93_CERCA
MLLLVFGLLLLRPLFVVLIVIVTTLLVAASSTTSTSILLANGNAVANDLADAHTLLLTATTTMYEYYAPYMYVCTCIMLCLVASSTTNKFADACTAALGCGVERRLAFGGGATFARYFSGAHNAFTAALCIYIYASLLGKSRRAAYFFYYFFYFCPLFFAKCGLACVCVTTILFLFVWKIENCERFC